MSDEPLEYQRAPIPDAVLHDEFGETISLSAVAQERAVLLLFAGPPGHQQEASLAAFAQWMAGMPLVGLGLVVSAVDAAHPDRLAGSSWMFTDPQGAAQSRFGPTDRPVAVLLGTDGLLAGGPAVGAQDVEEMVHDLVAHFQNLYGEAMRPATSISCKCITYGRVELLEESLESFLRQDYTGDHELVIVNDYPRQRLHFDHPRVRIYNLDFTFETIGEKENFAVSACRYDTVAVWDDDDVALPNHLRNIDRFFPGQDLLHWERGVAYVGDEIAGIEGLGNSGIVYRRPMWRRAGGHPLENAGYDVTFVNRLRGNGARVVTAAPAPREASWFYRRGQGSYHMSGLGTDHEGRPNVIRRHAEFIEEQRSAGLIPTGDIELKPRWRRDYIALLTDFCRQRDM